MNLLNLIMIQDLLVFPITAIKLSMWNEDGCLVLVSQKCWLWSTAEEGWLIIGSNIPSCSIMQ